MHCLGRTNSLKRCKNQTRFLVCKNHRYQLIILLIITIPSIVLTYSTLYKENIRPRIFGEKTTNIEITLNEDSDKELLYYDILTDNESSYETAFLPKENIINPTLEKIIKYYENNQSKKAIPIIEKVFKKEVKTQDEYLGYIVASYSLSQQFDKAAETVLIRNKNRKRWDYSLKLDLAQCIRYYSLLNTINDGLDLVDSLNVKYKSPILSHLWTVIPFDNLMHNIEEGIGQGRLTPEKEELQKLRKENQRLRMERDILKKATAFFAKESR